MLTYCKSNLVEQRNNNVRELDNNNLVNIRISISSCLVENNLDALIIGRRIAITRQSIVLNKTISIVLVICNIIASNVVRRTRIN